MKLKTIFEFMQLKQNALIPSLRVSTNQKGCGSNILSKRMMENKTYGIKDKGDVSMQRNDEKLSRDNVFGMRGGSRLEVSQSGHLFCESHLASYYSRVIRTYLMHVFSKFLLGHH